MRAIGLGRAAQAMYDAAPADQKAVLDAYAAGVNAKLATFPAGTPPAPEYGVFGYPFASTPPWTGVDTFAVARLLAFDLDWDGDGELEAAQSKAAYESAFPVGDPREGALSDLLF